MTQDIDDIVKELTGKGFEDIVHKDSNESEMIDSYDELENVVADEFYRDREDKIILFQIKNIQEAAESDSIRALYFKESKVYYIDLNAIDPEKEIKSLVKRSVVSDDFVVPKVVENNKENNISLADAIVMVKKEVEKAELESVAKVKSVFAIEPAKQRSAPAKKDTGAQNKVESIVDLLEKSEKASEEASKKDATTSAPEKAVGLN